MTPIEAREYWNTINADPLPAPVREYTRADTVAMNNAVDGLTCTGKQYLDLVQRLRIETGHPSNRELFDGSHLMTAVELDRMRELKANSTGS